MSSNTEIYIYNENVFVSSVGFVETCQFLSEYEICFIFMSGWKRGSII